MKSSIFSFILAGLLPILAMAEDVQPANDPADFFPIMAWGGPFEMGPDYFKEMKQCGFTIAGFAFPNQLDMLEQIGLKALVFDPELFQTDWKTADEAQMRRCFARVAGEVNEHPAVYGYVLKDEPGVELFPGLGKMVDIIRETAPGKLPYINLFPQPGWTVSGAASYDDYLQRFFAECHPTFLSYDFYGLREDLPSYTPGYWENFRTARRYALEHQVPFWFCAACEGFFGHIAPTKAWLSLQAYAAIAHGARGISWFTYQGISRNGWYDAPIDQFGAKTRTWGDLQYVNRTILNYAPLINRLRSDGAYHIGGDDPDINPPTPDSLIADIGHRNFLIGEFTHTETGDRYVLVINKDLEHARPAEIRWRTEPRAVWMQSPWGHGEEPWGGENIWFAPGGAVFLRVEFAGGQR